MTALSTAMMATAAVVGGGVDRRRARARLSGDRGLPSRPPVGAHDADLLLMIAAEAKFGGGEQPVYDVVVLACAIVDELGATLGAEDEERRHLALTNAAWKLDEDLGTIVEGAQRSPSGRISFNRIAEVEPAEVESGVDWGGGFGDRIVPAQRNQLILRILPGDRGHVRFLGGAQLEMIGAPVRVDDEIGDEVRTGRLDLDMDTFRLPGPAFRVADDPAHRVARGHGSGADQLLAFLQGDIRYLSRRGIDLVQGAGGVRINLHGVDVAVARRLHACRLIGVGDAVGRVFRFRTQSSSARHGLELAWKWKGLGDLDNLHGPGWFALEHGRLGIVIVTDFRRPEGGAGREPDRGQQDHI